MILLLLWELWRTPPAATSSRISTAGLWSRRKLKKSWTTFWHTSAFRWEIYYCFFGFDWNLFYFRYFFLQSFYAFLEILTLFFFKLLMVVCLVFMHLKGTFNLILSHNYKMARHINNGTVQSFVYLRMLMFSFYNLVIFSYEVSFSNIFCRNYGGFKSCQVRKTTISSSFKVYQCESSMPVLFFNV